MHGDIHCWSTGKKATATLHTAAAPARSAKAGKLQVRWHRVGEGGTGWEEAGMRRCQGVQNREAMGWLDWLQERIGLAEAAATRFKPSFWTSSHGPGPQEPMPAILLAHVQIDCTAEALLPDTGTNILLPRGELHDCLAYSMQQEPFLCHSIGGGEIIRLCYKFVSSGQK